jgi:hypothetical protein
MDPPRDKFDGDKGMSEHSDSDNCAYCPCPAQCSHDRGEVVNSCEESDSSSDGAEKPSAQSKKKFAKKKSAPAKKVKCQGKACPGLFPSEHHPMLDCTLDDFAKLVHRICYKKKLSKSSVARTLIKDLVFCNLGHHDKFIKSHSEMELTWTNDEKDGPEDPKTSQYYLVELLSSEENCQCYCDPSGALTKMKVCEEIASMLSSKGTKNKWKGENVYNKIQHIEQKMKSCHNGLPV